jgi:Tfp pilus assembly protein PilX
MRNSMEDGTIRQSDRQEGSILVIALLFMTLLSLLGITLLTVASTEHSLAYNAVWSEAALMAAEAGVNQGVSQVSANPVTSIAAIPVTTLATNYTYRSGKQTDSGPQPLAFVGTRTEAGYALSTNSGYTFNVYRITATGTGPNSAQREVESQVEYGPVSQ